jgi:hypothetical protein
VIDSQPSPGTENTTAGVVTGGVPDCSGRRQLPCLLADRLLRRARNEIASGRAAGPVPAGPAAARHQQLPDVPPHGHPTPAQAAKASGSASHSAGSQRQAGMR